MLARLGCESLSNDQRREVKNSTVDFYLTSKTPKGIGIALNLVAVKGAVYNRDVYPASSMAQP